MKSQTSSEGLRVETLLLHSLDMWLRFNSVQFNFICIDNCIQFYLYTMKIVSRRFPETQIMQISLTKVIILNPDQRKMAGKKKLPQREKKNI